MLKEILLFIGGMVVMVVGGELLVRGAAGMALRSKISKLMVGLTIVAFGTSAPELFVSVQTSLDRESDLAMGNIIGANICNLALILGLTSLITQVNINIDSIKIDWPMAMGSSLLLFLMAAEGYLVRHEGIFFLMVSSAYIYFLIQKAKKDRKIAALHTAELNIKDSDKTDMVYWLKDMTFIVVGSVALLFGSEWFVDGSILIFQDLGMSQRIIGLFVLAIGTSLPELVTSLIAATRHDADIAVGNLMGSNIFNVMAILGITSIIKTIHVSDEILKDMIWMLGITLIILPMMVYNRKLGKTHGVILLGIYVYYLYSLTSL
ncbi:MAG: calcium/sodium antiporter [Flammeovirgaceae bacterium]